MLQQTTSVLLAERDAAGHWTGELSSSALSTAVATIALGEIDRRSGTDSHTRLVETGLMWLANHANPDGGWGDTVRSRSNLSTTALAWAAFGAAGADERFFPTVRQAEAWIRTRSGSVNRLVPAIEADYGKDRTFSVPIIMTLALSGRLGSRGWRHVRPLPFELAAFPRAWFGALQLPVVSYALPALIAIGQAIHHHAPSRNPLARIIRNAIRTRVLRRLESLQPVNGGFLEATPLTAFVTMSLASMGQGPGPVAQRSAEFLRASIRPDGSWPIDTNLATWVTTLAIKALAHQPDVLAVTDRQRLRDWLLSQQYRTMHPYTGAAPGGWSWTDLPGGVPDADDTAGALLALRQLGVPDAATVRAATDGARWLLDLQNRDGGIPTFCRGWGTLPFDRSAPELTAHALRAWLAWRPWLEPGLVRRLDAAHPRAIRFLQRSQRNDGAWVPLWFGNEHAPDHQNPVYGTAQVLIALNEIANGQFADGLFALVGTLRRQAAVFLVGAQDPDGGWGGATGAPVSVEETALAVEALSALPEHRAAVRRGTERLLAFAGSGLPCRSAPIGLYFARLWYFERLYPSLFMTGALGRLAKTTQTGTNQSGDPVSCS